MPSEENYKNREIDSKFNALAEQIKGFKAVIETALGNQDNELAAIRHTGEATKEKAMKANGRVSELEVRARINYTMIKYTLLLLGFLIASIIIPIVSAYISSGRF